ncbi:hypothetical protein cyc_04204 [Cyclospora cayetanensis]|uniref:Uncharacterized protein n=1 Tax=Cyclospora cayetanensis TaxID=88456 RepID=A0A1D3D6P2_9EIME|nr:hypothetical protein cyc_04204 [Cyclospora cayetanensis]
MPWSMRLARARSAGLVLAGIAFFPEGVLLLRVPLDSQRHTVVSPPDGSHTEWSLAAQGEESPLSGRSRLRGELPPSSAFESLDDAQRNDTRVSAFDARGDSSPPGMQEAAAVAWEPTESDLRLASATGGTSASRAALDATQKNTIEQSLLAAANLDVGAEALRGRTDRWTPQQNWRGNNGEGSHETNHLQAHPSSSVHTLSSSMTSAPDGPMTLGVSGQVTPITTPTPATTTNSIPTSPTAATPSSNAAEAAFVSTDTDTSSQKTSSSSECRPTIGSVTLQADYLAAACVGTIHLKYAADGSSKFSERRFLVTNTSNKTVSVSIGVTQASQSFLNEEETANIAESDHSQKGIAASSSSADVASEADAQAVLLAKAVERFRTNNTSNAASRQSSCLTPYTLLPLGYKKNRGHPLLALLLFNSLHKRPLASVRMLPSLPLSISSTFYLTTDVLTRSASPWHLLGHPDPIAFPAVDGVLHPLCLFRVHFWLSQLYPRETATAVGDLTPSFLMTEEGMETSQQICSLVVSTLESTASGDATGEEADTRAQAGAGYSSSSKDSRCARLREVDCIVVTLDRTAGKALRCATV